jgi:hypothetical protein
MDRRQVPRISFQTSKVIFFLCVLIVVIIGISQIAFAGDLPKAMRVSYTLERLDKIYKEVLSRMERRYNNRFQLIYFSIGGVITAENYNGEPPLTYTLCAEGAPKEWGSVVVSGVTCWVDTIETCRKSAVFQDNGLPWKRVPYIPLLQSVTVPKEMINPDTNFKLEAEPGEKAQWILYVDGKTLGAIMDGKVVKY